MKKIIVGVISLGIIAAVFSNGFSVKSMNNNKTEDVASIQNSLEGKLIRFHVLANSDSSSDQALKLKVRDRVLQYIAPKLGNCKTIDESRNIIKQNDDIIKKIAQNTIKENGYSYNVVTMLSKENFPVKTYGNITLPPGEYEAYRILIGKAEGQNWWCVMFPPLCFIDITKGEVAYKETEKSMKKVLSDEEYAEVDNTKSLTDRENKTSSKSDGEKLEIRFKIFDEIKKLVSKI